MSILAKPQWIDLDTSAPANHILVGKNQIGEIRVWDIPSEELNYSEYSIVQENYPKPPNE